MTSHPAAARAVDSTEPSARLRDFVHRYNRIFVLTGAGCSTDSGIPDYRDTEGNWKRPQPVQFKPFMTELATRQRYWARSLIGWRRFGRAQPNDTHRALSKLESAGRVQCLVTQNVDRLHQAAGNTNVIDLHGRLDLVRCMTCDDEWSREHMQTELVAANPHWLDLDARVAPDGDADLEGLDFSTFRVPDCHRCGGILKPDVVFFGESVPHERVAAAMGHIQAADAMLVVGSSLMVYSGYRFAAAAAGRGIPVAAVNLGRTRADELLQLKIAAPCASALSFLL